MAEDCNGCRRKAVRVSEAPDGWTRFNTELLDWVRERACLKSELWAAMFAFLNCGWRVLILAMGCLVRDCNCDMLRIAVDAACDTRADG